MMKSKSNNRLLKLTAIAAFCFMQFAMSHNSFGQCQPYIRLDDSLVIANSITATGITLPLWLTAGQKLAADQMVQSISVIEFTVTGTNTLEFSQVKKVTTVQTVPAGKAWKIESIVKTASLSDSNGAIFSGVGTYTFTIPACASYICIELWGGGGGGYASTNGGGGGGGAYGQGCFNVTPGSSLTVTVGSKGILGAPGTAGGTSSVTGTSVNISASGGSAGASAAGGAGGTSITAAIQIPGGNGSVGFGSYNGGAGGAAGGSPTSPGGFGATGGMYLNSTTFKASTDGGFPGGGGGGQATGGGTSSSGSTGQVKITW